MLSAGFNYSESQVILKTIKVERSSAVHPTQQNTGKMVTPRHRKKPPNLDAWVR